MDRKYVNTLIDAKTGAVTEFKPAGKAFTLKELQTAVEGYIEVKPTKDGRYMFIMNEEGKLENLPKNALATHLFLEKTNYIDILVGNVAIVECSLLE